MSATARLVRVGVVGAGAMAEYHAKKFSALPGVTVAACADRFLDRARQFAQRLGIPRWFASTAELCRSGEVDGVAIALADEGHAPAARDALQHHLPVFAEKPLARTLADAEAIRDAARAASVPGVVNFSKRNAPAVARARQLVAEGRLGRIRAGSFHYLQSWLLQDAWGRWDVTPRWRWRVSPSASTQGVLGDLGSHLVDTVRLLLGEIDQVSCAATADTPDPDRPGQPGAPDSFAALFRLASGPVVTVRASWRARGFLDELAFQVEGEQGALSVNLAAARDVVRLFDPHGGGWTEIRAPGVPSTYDQFIDAVRSGAGGEAVPGVPGLSDGAEVQRVLHACVASTRAGAGVSVKERVSP